MKPPPKTLVVNILHRDADGPHVIPIGRKTSYGNPFTHLPLRTTNAFMEVPTVFEALRLYRRWLLGDLEIRDIEPPSEREILALAGRTLGCVCVPKPTRGAVKVPVCHGQILAELADNLARGKRADGTDPT